MHNLMVLLVIQGTADYRIVGKLFGHFLQASSFQGFFVGYPIGIPLMYSVGGGIIKMGIGSRLHVVLSELFASHLKIGQKLLIPLHFLVLTSEKVHERIIVMEWSESFFPRQF